MSDATTAPEKAAAPPPPGALNIVLALVSIGLALGLLCLASRAQTWIGRIAAAAAFSFVNNTIFSLLHEATHGNFHRNRAVNDAFGRLTAAFFPTAFTFQQICHLGHHRRNRTEAELFDYYRPGDNRFVKWIQWYGILTGVYWTLSPLACVAYLLCPWAFRPARPDSTGRGLSRQTGADAMLSGFENAPETTLRLEILLTILIQAVLVWTLHLTLLGWACCYAAFAFNWSSLQYADHAWSELDVHEGAWNLKVNPVVGLIFLNYHHHRAHHQRPWVSWLRLPEHVDFTEPRPSFLSVYLRMWRGPRPLPPELEARLANPPGGRE